MKARELDSQQRFRVRGLYEVWECLHVYEGSVMVRPTEQEKVQFHTADGEAVTVCFRPKAFYISLETDVETIE